MAKKNLLNQIVAAHLSTISDGVEVTRDDGVVWVRVGRQFKASPHGAEDPERDSVWFTRAEILAAWTGPSDAMAQTT